MSSIASIYNVPSVRSEWEQWAFAHMAHHRDIIRLIKQAVNIQLTEYILDPFDPNDAGVWFDQHQVMHQDMDLVLGIAGYDLSEIDFKNEQERAGWIFLNATEHKQASDTLGIG